MNCQKTAALLREGLLSGNRQNRHGDGASRGSGSYPANTSNGLQMTFNQGVWRANRKREEKGRQ